VQPRLIVCDEAVSALDVSVQAQVINLLQDLQQRFGLAYLFIAHDLAVVRHTSHRVAVMYLGRIVEVADTDALFGTPRHPYTQALLAAIPRAEPGQHGVHPVPLGDVPTSHMLPSGCHFHTRCTHAQSRCSHQAPVLEQHGEQAVACHFWREIPITLRRVDEPALVHRAAALRHRLKALQAAFLPADPAGAPVAP
jgi:oligopeptide/dipeptide ABC transporter ATP-binding protein